MRSPWATALRVPPPPDTPPAADLAFTAPARAAAGPRRVARLAAALLGLLVLAGAGVCAAQVDPSGAWRTLHTPHFRVHFRPAHRAVAARAAAEAERAWTLLATELAPPRGVVDVTLADDVDTPNGYASVFPSNRVTVFLASPATDVALQSYDDWLRLVLVHELTHLFQLDRSRGVWRVLQGAFGRAPGLFPNAYQPSWVTEGIAVYYESRFTGAGRAQSSFHTQLIGATAERGGRSPWDAVGFARWPAGVTPYAWGGRFFSRAAGAGRDTLVPRFVEGSAGQLIPFRVGRPWHRATGGQLDSAWRAALAVEAALSADTGRVLVRGMRSAPIPRINRNRDRLAYLEDDGRGARRLRVTSPARPGGGWTHRVTGDARYDWRGDTLLVTQLDFTDRRHVRGDLYRWEPDGAWRRVTRGARVTEPRTGGDLVAMLATRAGEHTLLVGGATVRSAGVEWGSAVPSPDGRAIAAARHAAGRWSLVRWPTAAPESLEVLFDGGGVVSDPAWTGDGGVAFSWDGSGLPQVYRCGEARRCEALSADPWGARHPVLTADGSLLYTTLRADGWQLRQVRAGMRPMPASAPPAAFDSAPAAVTRETGYAWWPSLRPHFWVPLYADAGVAGRFFGAFTAGNDAIGRFAYAARGLVGPEARLSGSLAVMSDAWAQPTLDLWGARDWSGIGRTLTGIAVLEREDDAAVGATFVARRWRTRASLRVAAEYERDRFLTEPDTVVAAVCPGCVSRDLVGASVTVTVAHAVVAPLAISAQDGVSLSVTARRQERQGGPEWANELRSRLALYLHLPTKGFAFPVVAARISAATATGPVAGVFGVGGVSGGIVPLPAGEVLGSRRSFPVRGYAADAVIGPRAIATSLELRLPLALLGQGIGHLPVGVDRLALSLFGDAGDAWSSGGLPTPPRLRSLGGEIVGDLLFPSDLPIRLRAGVGWPLVAAPDGVTGARGYLVLGSDY